MFTYICGGVQWSAVGSSSKIAVVGYNAAGAQYFNHRLSGYSSVGDALSCAVRLGKRRKRQGGDGAATIHIDIQTVIGRCLEMSEFDTSRYSLSEINKFVNKLDPCPCTRMQANADTARFRRQNNSQCFVSMKPIIVTPDNHLTSQISLVRQCCYDGRYYRK